MPGSADASGPSHTSAAIASDPLAIAAIAYAKRGWPVFALQCGSKLPRKGSHGHLDATSDPDAVARMWAEHPGSNIGLACGVLVAIDLDGSTAIERWGALAREHGCPMTAISRTRRGYHLVFRAPEGMTVRSRAETRAKGEDGIDIKGAGGFIVLPPSIVRGHAYAWVRDASPGLLPAWAATTLGSPQASDPLALGPMPPHLAARASAPLAGGETWSTEEEARIRSALAAVPANGRDAWIAVGMALKGLRWERSDGTDLGYAIWRDWSATCEEKFSDGACEYQWASFKRGGRTLGTLYHLARESGWADIEHKPQVKAINGTAHALPAQLTANPIKWRDVDHRGRVKSTVANASAWLEAIGAVGSHDVFHERLILAGKAIAEWAGELSDHAEQALRALAREQWGVEFHATTMHDAILQACVVHPFDPVLAYLDALVWDGRKRLAAWLSDYLGAARTALNAAFGRLTLIGAVRRARVPGVKFDQILVLEGIEGTGKSTAIRIMAGDDNFSDAPILSVSDREQQEAVTGVWLYEIADLVGKSRADVDRIKAFASRQVDRARPAYGRCRVDQPRRCVFIGTTNESGYLRSQTGNRRFWPVSCGEVRLRDLEHDRDQLWAEAREEERASGIELGRELWGAAREAQEERRAVDPWEEKIAALGEQSPGMEAVPGEWRIASRVLLDLVLGVATDRQSDACAKRLAHVMRRCGWSGPEKMRHAGVPQRCYRKAVAP